MVKCAPEDQSENKTEDNKKKLWQTDLSFNQQA